MEQNDDVEKVYKLIKVDNEDKDTITKFVYDKNTYKMVPVYYRVELAKTEYGTGDSAKHYQWTTDEKGLL